MLKSKNIDKFAGLNKDEELILQSIQTILQSNDDTAKSGMIKRLTSYPLRLLYAFSQLDQEINKLLETNDTLNASWSTRLQNMGYPNVPITSFDQKKTVSLFSLMKGAFLLDILNQHPDELHQPHYFSALNKACELGMYQALVMRLNFYSDNIFDSHRKLDADEIETTIQIMLRDVHKLSNLYWAMGCIDSSLILFNISNYYFDSPEFKPSVNQFFMFGNINQFSWLTKYDDQRRPYPIIMLETAVENIYIAKLLSELPQSEAIANQLTHAEGLLAGFEDSFSSFDDLQTRVLNELESLHVPLVETFCRQAYKHAVKIVRQHYPNHKMPDELEQLKLK